MRKVRKPLPVSLRKAIITKNKNRSGNDGLTFIACSRTVKVYLRGEGYLGNAYFDGKGFYFSTKLTKSLYELPYPQSSNTMGYISWFLGGILEASGFSLKS